MDFKEATKQLRANLEKERFDIGIKRLAGYRRPSLLATVKPWEMGISENRIGAARIVPRTVLSLRLRVFRPP